MGTACEAMSYRWITAFYFCQLMSSQPPAYYCRLWCDPPLGSPHLGRDGTKLYHQLLQKPFAYGLGRCSSAPEPIGWTKRLVVEVRVLLGGVHDSREDASHQGMCGKETEVRKKLPCIMYFYYTFLKNGAVGKL